jgi:chromosome segregation ATPase
MDINVDQHIDEDRLTEQKDEVQEPSTTYSRKRINQLERDFQDTQIYNEKLTKELETSRYELSLFREKVETLNLMLQDEQSRRFDLESELDKVREDLKSKTKELIDLQYSMALSRNQELQLKADVKEAECTITHYKSEIDSLYAKLDYLTEALSEEKANALKASSSAEDAQHQYNNIQTLLTDALQENCNLAQTLSKEREAHSFVQQLLNESNNALSSSKLEISSLGNEMELLIHHKEASYRNVSILEAENQKKDNRIHELEQMVRDMEMRSIQYDCAMKVLEQELAEATKNYGDQLLSMQRKHEEISSYQASGLAQQQALNQQLQEEKRLLEADLYELEMESSNSTNEVLTQLEVLEKNNTILSDELLNTKDLLENTSDNVKLLSSELDICRQKLLSKEHDKVALEIKLGKMIDLLHEKEHQLLLVREQQRNESLEKSDTEDEISSSNKSINYLEECDKSIRDRDRLEKELTQSRIERVMLCEKIKSLENAIGKGEKEYVQRMGEIKMMRQTIKQLHKEIYSLKKGSAVTKEFIRKDAELLEERRKVKILWDELDKPLNVHRWRRLEGSDPSTLEMIMKIQTLQKRLIKKTEEVMP